MDIINAISTFGFPVAACLALGLYVKYTQDQNRQDRRESEDALKALTEKVAEAITNNTVALMRIIDKIGGSDDDIK